MHFFSVSKINNINTIAKNCKNLHKYYASHSLSIIVPNKQLIQFENFFNDLGFEYINLIPEEKYISLSEFNNIFEKVKKDLNIQNISNSRLGWYYQQALKLSFYLENAKYKKIVQIDSDTFLIKKINFFKNNHSIIYFNPHEKCDHYRESCEDIFKLKIPNWKTCTSQIGSMTPLEYKFFIKKLSDYLPKKNNENEPQWVSKIILKSVLKRNKTIEGALISDQDITGTNNILAGSKYFKNNQLLRWGLEAKLTDSQIKIASYLGFIHVTYEDWIIKDKEKLLSNTKFLLLVLRTLLVFITKPKYSYLYPFWKKHLRKIILGK